MVFADLVFLYTFLPLNLILYYMTGNKNIRNFILVSFSMFFYTWGEPIYITLLIFSATIDYIHGLVIEHNQGKFLAKLMVLSSVVLNLGLLGVFKYGDFIISNLNTFFGLNIPLAGFSLPIGISFYTFQTISYTIDVYKGDVKAQRSYMKFMLFVSLYHQLVAGPIVRYKDIENDINNRMETTSEVSEGVNRFLIGLMKKTLIANTMGQLSVPILSGELSALSVVGSWFGILLFALQIYYDFSGYSDMAIGLGKMFGFHYNENFNYPYIATSASEFWRRWHISLGSFFRDYIYIPLGGGRKHIYRNLLITWFATGLWHGASFNFILWGLYFGLLIAIERLFLKKILEKLPKLFGHLYLCIAVLIGWVFFYFESLSNGLNYLKTMFGLTSAPMYDYITLVTLTNNSIVLFLAILFSMPLIPLFKLFISEKLSENSYAILYSAVPFINIILLLVSTAMLVGESYNPFLYFRF